MISSPCIYYHHTILFLNKRLIYHQSTLRNNSNRTGKYSITVGYSMVAGYNSNRTDKYPILGVTRYWPALVQSLKELFAPNEPDSYFSVRYYFPTIILKGTEEGS